MKLPCEFNETHLFKDVNCGEVFATGKVYMKIKPIAIDGVNYNAIDLGTAEIKQFSDEDYIKYYPNAHVDLYR